MQSPNEPQQEQDATRSLGIGMTIAAWVVVILMLALLFDNILGQQRNPNRQVQGIIRDDGVRETLINRNHYGHYITSGQINRQPVVFLLDTGASDVSIPQSVADRLGLERGAEIRYQTANGIITGYATTLESISVGTITLHNIRGSINPHMDGDEILLGMSFLRHLELVQRDKQLTLRLYPQ
jgi:aspartyl protease family protein